MANGGGVQGDALHGMKAISNYFGGRSEATILKLIREESFPAKKMAGGWYSHKHTIDAWVEEQTRAGMGGR